MRPSEEDSGLEGADDFGLRSGTPLGIGGAFKTLGLRNVEFTGPYFHNGGQATLERVMEFITEAAISPIRRIFHPTCVASI